jgi:hypothetical protein
MLQKYNHISNNSKNKNNAISSTDSSFVAQNILEQAIIL